MIEDIALALLIPTLVGIATYCINIIRNISVSLLNLESNLDSAEGKIDDLMLQISELESKIDDYFGVKK